MHQRRDEAEGEGGHYQQRDEIEHGERSAAGGTVPGSIPVNSYQAFDHG